MGNIVRKVSCYELIRNLLLGIAKGNKHKYTPDVYIEFTNDLRMLIEIKESLTLEKNYYKFEERWQRCEEQSKKQGILFLVITDIEIRTPRLANIWFTLSSSKCKNMSSYITKLSSLIPNKGIQYGNLCLILAEYLGIEINSASQIICYAIYHGLVFVDSFTTRNITNATIIRKKPLSINGSPFPPLWEEYNWDLSFSKNFFRNELEKQEISETKDPVRSLNSTLIPKEYKEETEIK